MLYNFLDDVIVREDMENIYNSMNKWDTLKAASFYITGATGMLASYFTYFLIYLNEIRGYSIEIYAGVRDIKKAESRFGTYIEKKYLHLIQYDIIEKMQLQGKIDYIIHAASLASPQYYGKMPVETILPNVIGTYHLLEYGKAVDIKGFLFFSSGAVYGSFDGYASEDSIGTLNFLDLGNCYSEAKRCGEAMCRAYFSEYGVPTKSVRICHAYGPTMDIMNDKRAFSEFVKDIVDCRDIVLKSNGLSKRMFCYISDAISGLYKILLDGENGEAYNLGNEKEWISIKDLAKTLVNLYPKKKLKLVFQNRDDKGYCLSPEKQTYPVNTEKIRRLGWTPQIGVEDGFRRVIDVFERGMPV